MTHDAPTVLVLGGISSHRHAVSLNPDSPGWWQELFDVQHKDWLRHHRVLSVDYLGGNGDSSGPRHWDRSSLGAFPQVSTLDQAQMILRLLDHLEIDRLHAVIGASYGGLVAQQLGVLAGPRIRELVILGAAHRADAQASALRWVQRQILSLGQTPELDDTVCVALARALAVTTYRSKQEFNRRFSSVSDLEGYLTHQGQRFSARFDAEAYANLSQSIDDHDLDPALIQCPTQVVAFEGDQISPPELVKTFHDALPHSRGHHWVSTLYGHDGFLKETKAIDTLLSPLFNTHFEAHT